MLATTFASSLHGLRASLVRVEVESSRGPGSFDLVGLAEASVRESRVRVRSALAQVGVSLDEHRIVVNLAPGDVRKGGAGFDLAIAVATLAALGRVELGALGDALLLGELSLTGELRAVRGVLPQLLGAREHGLRRAIVPVASAGEAAVVGGVDALAACTLVEVVAHLRGEAPLSRATPSAERAGARADDVDMSEVRGQPLARRALELAAAGHHHVLLVGPPGAGKTMLARRLPGLLPPLSEEESLETTAVHSVAGLLAPSQGLLTQRPFRAPHHTVSAAGLVGGGAPLRPGEISLAHHGVLFLDELAELKRATLETLRQPIEEGHVVISRAREVATYPARPLLVAASNPCPCGFFGDGTSRCKCPMERVRQYLARLSGPLVDRLDVHVQLPPASVVALAEASVGEGTEAIRARVARARQVQRERRLRGEVRATDNGSLGPADLDRVASPDAAGRALLVKAAERLGLSARAFAKVRRVARTVADLAGSDAVTSAHVAEAVGLRAFDRGIAEAAPA